MAKKLTKIIAALGAVTGFGIAMLPLGASAEDVTINFTISPTVGTVNVNCSGAVNETEVAGVPLEGMCQLSGSSNTGVRLSLKDADTSLSLTHTNGTNIIEPISPTANMTTMNQADIATMNSGRGGWGFRYVVGSATNLQAAGNYSNWNGITSSDVTIAQSANTTSGAQAAGAAIHFRAVTPPSQAPGTYSDIVTVTVATLN